MREINFRSSRLLLILVLVIGCVYQSSLKAFLFSGFGDCIYPPYVQVMAEDYNCVCYDDCGCGNGNGYDFSKSLFSSFVPVVLVEVAFGETVGVRADYATIGTQIYSSFSYDPSTAFVTTFKAHGLNYHGAFKFASNIGLGFRHFDKESLVTKGVHVFFDFREGKNHNFNSIGFSLEYLARWYQLRINGYCPVGRDSKRTDHKVFQFPGGLFAECTSRQHSLKGIDGEVEFPILCTCDWGAGIIFGSYYFTGSCSSTSTGGLAIARLNWHNLIAVEARYTYDRLYGSRGQGVLALNIPLTSVGSRNFACDGFTRQLVRRFDIIPLDECCCWISNF